ncbi:three component ABC system middle component, partial [Pectobacterium versatile]|uniref:three component ABC system middle component n=1 Tax=Pectobacterium versatile TaxID=2488639 RepID=UPI003017EC97
MKPSELISLLHSPLWIASLLEHFLSGAQRIKKEGLDFELIFLAIPILLDEDSLADLAKGNVNSNMSKIMGSSNLQSSYFKAKWSIDYYKPVTKKAIIILASAQKLSVSSRVFLYDPIKSISETDEYKKKYHKAAYNLGAML